MIRQLKIKCPRPDCKSGGEFFYIGEERKQTIVNEDGMVVIDSTKHWYKCCTCGMTFTTDFGPITKKRLDG